MSRAVVATAFGGPEVLEIVEEPDRPPGAGEVAVDVVAIGVNPIDHKLYSGTRISDPAVLPMHLGFEAAGVIAAVGPEVDGVAVGDEVVVYPAAGAYATRVVVPVGSIVPKPAEVSWPEAAGVILAGATAWHALAVVDAKAGDTILVHGAAGGVGVLLVQLAVARDITVVATGSEVRHDLLRGLGAVPVTYGAGLLERVRSAAPGGVDAALDLVGTDEAFEVSLALVPDRQRIATIVDSARGLQLGIKAVGNMPGADPGIEIRQGSRTPLLEAVAAGELTVPIAATYALERAADAHREIQRGHTSGKIILLTG
jgi:NADPH2:quinone reductase